MNNERILDDLGVCGLDCSRCVSRKNGEIQRLSLELKAALTGFEKKSPVFSNFVPALADYEHFASILDFLTAGTCEGCRSGQCLTLGCAARDCHREKAVDFCSQCDEYPCTRNRFSPDLDAKWRRNCEAMKKEGLEAYYERSKLEPQY